MLSKALQATTKMVRPNALTGLASRSVYTKETQPYVFINEHTKVIVQGMTGKHVSLQDTRIYLTLLGHFPHSAIS